MTMTEEMTAAATATAQKVQVEESTGIVEFTGYLIAEISTRAGRQPRWTELKLYQVTDGDGGYALANSGKSVLYHTEGEPCNTGLPRLVSGIPDSEYDMLVAHTQKLSRDDPGPCRPPWPGDLYEDDTIYVEMDRNGVTRCKTAAEVLDTLRKQRRHAGKVEDFLSGPAERLLHLAAEADSGIKAEITRKRKL